MTLKQIRANMFKLIVVAAAYVVVVVVVVVVVIAAVAAVVVAAAVVLNTKHLFIVGPPRRFGALALALATLVCLYGK
eukprot:9263496-Pyramimonas_sp.AAC.1